MKTNPWPMMLLIFAVAMGALVRHEERQIAQQRATINALIDLNHDKSVYIDAGCPGHFTGAEEKLQEEAHAH